jgi:flagellar hook-associated protein 3 FlgL
MRITQRAISTTALAGLNKNLAAVNKIQQQMTSGTMISRPSDSPTGTNTSMYTRKDLAGVAQQSRNISDGVAVLNSADSAIRNILEQVQQARSLTVQALNDGAMNDQASQAIATQVAGLRESVLAQANEVVQGRPLFGGVSTGTAAYSPSGAYVGVGGANGIALQPVMRRVSDVEAIRVDVTGPEAFGDPASGKDLFAVLGSISTDIADPAALAGHLTDLDAVLKQMLTATADLGTRAARMDTAQNVNATRELTLTAQLSATEDIDLPKSIMELNMQQTGYQAALKATAQAIQPTLLDFLR